MPSLNEAIAAAAAKKAQATGTPQAAAGAAPAAETGVVNPPANTAVSQITQTSAPSLPAAVTTPGSVMTLRDAATRPSFAIEKYLKVNEYGILIGQDATNTFKSDVLLVIRPGGIQPTEAIKYGKNPTEYKKTYDRVRTTDGGSWVDAVALAQRIEPDARPYFSVDIAGTLAEDQLDKNGAILAPAGTMVGFSTSTTNAPLVTNFIKANIDNLETKNMLVRVGFEKKAKSTYQWGLFTFEMVGEFEDTEGAAA